MAETIYYDGSCGLCSASVARLRRLLSPRGFVFEPLQNSRRFSDVPDEMKLLTRDRRILGGAEAIVYAARRIWWAWPLWAFSRVPGVTAVMRAGYRVIARRRGCVAGVCRRGD